ncbi:MAG: HisA/HisF-related TIM barrel protein [Solidesulfovibrio sp.]|uniref:HisA/HisF-related TIM barrel protein n=1 Tax=Solidesulfovibrio sp. TaxID=2910990 RepID=UPI002B219C0D|nr:HisA/HisF-related TIM barrel protein [Solidesulfovibrio sp.]MEA4855453.1 HisA/HisF-related TIM barrel protein [Solidesulfovibrio sp.]
MTAPARPRLVPVLDILDGVVVQAVRGERQRYRPVRSRLVEGAAPLAVARALFDVTRAEALYIADLDAILGRGGNVTAVSALSEALGCAVWVDGGVADAAGARAVLACGAARVVVGTECLEGLDALAGIVAAAGRERLVVSLDVLGGRLLSRAPELSGLEPLAGLRRLAGLGCDRFILLTLDGVGTGGGPDWRLLEPARRLFPEAAFWGGGGVRGPADLRRAAALGLDGMLVGTALHQGWIGAADLAAMGYREEAAWDRAEGGRA